MWELDCEEGWAPKNWCFWTAVLEKTLESPLDCKEIQPVHSEGDQPWDFFGQNDAKAEIPVLWPPHAKSWLIGKDFDAGRDWGQEKKGTTKVVGTNYRVLIYCTCHYQAGSLCFSFLCLLVSSVSNFYPDTKGWGRFNQGGDRHSLKTVTNIDKRNWKG